MISRFINHVLDNVYWIVCVCVQVPVGDFPRIGNKAAASPRYEVPSRHAGEVRLMDHASLNVTRLVGRGTAVVSGRKADGGRMRERERDRAEKVVHGRQCQTKSASARVRLLFLVVSAVYKSSCYQLGCMHSAAAAHSWLSSSAHDILELSRAADKGHFGRPSSESSPFARALRTMADSHTHTHAGRLSLADLSSSKHPLDAALDGHLQGHCAFAVRGEKSNVGPRRRPETHRIRSSEATSRHSKSHSPSPSQPGPAAQSYYAP